MGCVCKCSGSCVCFSGGRRVWLPEHVPRGFCDCIDVNPSIELKTSRSEKILSATALNGDAEKVLGDMNLKNVDLDVAMNAIIGVYAQKTDISAISIIPC